MGLMDNLFRRNEDEYYDDEYYDDDIDMVDDEGYHNEDSRGHEYNNHHVKVVDVDDAGVTVILSAPESSKDCDVIIENLKDNKVISVSLERADDEQSQRIIDVLTGAAFALRATLQQISINNDKSFLITPGTVKIENNVVKNIRKDSTRIMQSINK